MMTKVQMQLVVQHGVQPPAAQKLDSPDMGPKYC